MPSDEKKQSRGWIIGTFSMFVLSLVAFFAWSWIVFESIPMALSYLSGERLLIDTQRRSFGPLEVGRNRTVEFVIGNKAGHAIKILGCNSPCTCIMAENLPMTLHPGERHAIQINVRSRKDRIGDVAETLRLFTDEPSRSVIVLNVVGRFTEASSSTKSASEGE